MKSRFLPAALALSVSLGLPASAAAQGGYFGRNKVQYRDFKFEVLKTTHFDIYYYPEEAQAAQMAARMAERWYTRLSTLLDHDLSGRQPLILYASGPHFRQTNAIQGEIGEGTGGVTEAYKRRIVLPFAGPIESTDHVLGHELVHAFQYDITGTNVSGNVAGALGLPLWFIEGMAEYLSIGPVDPHTAMWIRDASRQAKLPNVSHLNSGEYFPYRWGQALWAYIGGKYGDDAIAGIYRDAIRSGSAEMALKNVSGLDDKALSAEWHTAIHDQYGPVLEATTRAKTFGELVSKDQSKHATNVSPALSPDGRFVVYFSSRDLLSMDLFLAEASTGRIVRKLVDTGTNSHFTTLQFIGSAGAWSPDSHRFVVPAVRGGEAVLAIIDVQTGNRVREIELPSVGEVLNPSWSPDGKSIVFSATVGGDSDLFIYDLTAN